MSSLNETNNAYKKGLLSRKKILETAISLADAGGIESISMRRIAGKLGVQAMSLYNHVKNKDDIIDGIVELAVSEIELPDINDHWKTAMTRRAVSAHEVLVRHPWATLVLVSRPNAGPAMLRYVDATLASLRGAGFSWEEADRIWNAMDSHIYGFTLQQLNFPFDAPDYPDTAREFLDSTDVSEFPCFNELARLVMEGKHPGVQDFTFGLELLLDGLEKRLKRSNASECLQQNPQRDVIA